MTALQELSPPEIVGDLISRWGMPGVAPGGVVIGPADDPAQQGGVIQMVSAGLPDIEHYARLQWSRAQVRVLAGTLAKADLIAQNVQRDIHGLVRKRARQASTDSWYLVHLCNITAGPSQHYDSEFTWEVLLFAEILIGTDPLDPADFG